MNKEDKIIKDLIDLENDLENIIKKENFKIEIPNVQHFDMIRIFEKYNLNYSRLGFKRWELSMEKNLIGKRASYLRTGVLLSYLIFLSYFISQISLSYLVPLWAYSSSSNILSGVLSNILYYLISASLLVFVAIIKKSSRHQLHRHMNNVIKKLWMIYILYMEG